MRLKIPLSYSIAASLVLAAFVSAAPTPAHAEVDNLDGAARIATSPGVAPSPLAPDTIFVQYGSGESTHTLIGGLQWLSERRLQLTETASTHLYLEVAAGRWRSALSGERDSWWVSQVTVAPAARIKFADSPLFLDGGVGPSWIAPLYQNSVKRFSTKFNFRSHVAVGYVLPGPASHDLSLRVEHFSNARIRRPNPGVNLFAIRYSRAF